VALEQAQAADEACGRLVHRLPAGLEKKSAKKDENEGRGLSSMNHACYNYKKSGTYEAHCIARIRYMKIRMAKQIKREGMDDGRYSERRELIKMLACSKLGHCWIVHTRTAALHRRRKQRKAAAARRRQAQHERPGHGWAGTGTTRNRGV